MCPTKLNTGSPDKQPLHRSHSTGAIRQQKGAGLHGTKMCPPKWTRWACRVLPVWLILCWYCSSRTFSFLGDLIWHLVRNRSLRLTEAVTLWCNFWRSASFTRPGDVIYMFPATFSPRGICSRWHCVISLFPSLLTLSFQFFWTVINNSEPPSGRKHTGLPCAHLTLKLKSVFKVKVWIFFPCRRPDPLSVLVPFLHPLK